jgi:hypothetical protein
MPHSTTLFVGLDVHKDSSAVAYGSDTQGVSGRLRGAYRYPPVRP